MDANKTCAECDVLKPLTEFHRNKNRSDGRNNNCKDCANARIKSWKQDNPERYRIDYRLRRFAAHHITEERYLELYLQQGEACAACHEPVENPSIDHDHQCCSGRKSCGQCIRGLLCSHCNSALGFVDDSIVRLELLIAYLKNFQS